MAMPRKMQLLRQDITPTLVRRLFDYEPHTGTLRRKTNFGNNRLKSGMVVGCQRRNGYVYVKIQRLAYPVHRLAWVHYYGVWPDRFIDHINGVRDDNRIANLREANDQQNAFNQRRHKRNSCGFKGVVFKARIKKWVANIRINGTQTHLGCFTSPEAAHAAYVAAARAHYGEFANDGENK